MITKRELLTAAKTLGIKGVNTNTPNPEIQAKINAVLGSPDLGDDDQRKQTNESIVTSVAMHGEEAVAKETGAVLAGARDIPNLSPTGAWHGKRAKIKRVKTGHNDMGGAIFKWNGWPCIVPIDKAVDVAWPIFIIIQGCTGMNMEITTEEDPRDKGRVKNVKNITYFDKYPHQFMGVTPGTESLPESPLEYVLDQYVEDFPGYTVRMWRQLCILFEINDQLANIVPGAGPEKETKARMNAIHYQLNLPQGADLVMRKRIRDERRDDIGMEAKAA